MNVNGVLDHVDLEVRHGRFNVPKRFEPISDTGSKSNPHYKGLAYVPITERDVDQMILLEFVGAEPTVIIKIWIAVFSLTKKNLFIANLKLNQ